MTGIVKVPTSKDFIVSSEKKSDQDLDKIEEITFDDLMNISTEDKSDCLLGDRFLTTEGSWLIVAQSGIGKSVLAMQMAISFALGYDLWGLKPIKPLKMALVQAENNKLDLAEPFKSMVKYYNVGENQKDLLRSNLSFYSNSTEAGAKFPIFLDGICEKHKPNIIIVDPLLSYIGGDISKQDVCSKFLRNDLHPILIKHQIGIIFMHHTSKPKGEDTANRILSYAGAGSADLTNYSRAVSTVFENKNDNNVFDFTFSKRGKRFDDIRVAPTIHLKHAGERDIYWKETEEPLEKEKKKSLKYDNLDIENLPPMKKEDISNQVYDLIVRAGIDTGNKGKDIKDFWNNNFRNRERNKDWLIFNQNTSLWQGKYYLENTDHLQQM